MARKCSPSWLSSYAKYNDCSEAPEVYHLWVGLTILSSVLRRNVYKDRGIYTLYPNLYTFLVGPSGTRKSTAIRVGARLLRGGVTINSPGKPPRKAKGVQDPPYIIDSFRTPEWFISELKNVCSQSNPPKTPFMICADEAPVFFRRAKYAMDMIPILINLYDCETSRPGTQARGIEEVIDPYPTLLCGVIPEILVDLMPRESAAGGFASRVVWVYSDDTSRCSPHPELEARFNPEMYLDLVHDLNEISLLKGEMSLTDDAYKWFDSWYRDIRSDIATTVDGRYMGYQNRKGDMVYKIAMLLSIAESSDMMVTRPHFQTARAMFEILEPDLGKVYQGTSGRVAVLDTRDIVFKIIHAEGERGISRTMLTKKCYNNRISARELDEAVDQLLQEGVLSWQKKGNSLWYEIIKKK